MAFTAEQKRALEAPLHPKHVATRQQSGQRLSYVEGWHVVAEANRIFGFDAWSRETVDIRCVTERERKIGKPPNQRDGWGVSYTARVRVTVDGVVREGVGAGHGIDADCGSAHESAIKEAETDAMKRALMTFGNPFGLALYDKSQANVGVDEPERQSAAEFVTTPDGRKRKPGPRLTDGGEIAAILEALRENVGKQPNAEKIKAYAKSQAAGIGSLPDAEFDTFMRDYDDLLKLRAEAA